MRHIRNVLFDLDGTLVDSESLCNRAFLDLLPQLTDTVESLVRKYRGKKLATILADIENRIGIALPAGFERDYRGRVAELFANELTLNPGVREMLDAVRVPKCVASSGPLQKIRQALDATGIAAHFGGNVFSSYEIGSWKPEPGLFQHAARAMGFASSNCVVIEDSETGIQAAHAAGMRALQYLPDANARPHPLATPFANMTLLPELLSRYIPS